MKGRNSRRTKTSTFGRAFSETRSNNREATLVNELSSRSRSKLGKKESAKILGGLTQKKKKRRVLGRVKGPAIAVKEGGEARTRPG